MDDHVRVIDRVFDIIEVLSNSSVSLSLSEIAKSTDMSKTTVHRLLSTMCNRQYIEKNKDHTYTIGIKMFETVSYHINNLELQTESRPYLSNLKAELGLTSHLGILDGDEVVYVEKMDTYPGTRLYTQVGYRSPAYCSSMGKCLLAALSGDELEDALYHCSFNKFTKNTITNFSDFKRYLKIVRNQGWAMDNEEFQLGHKCVGAPIYDYRGDAVAAISASGPSVLLSDDKLELVIHHVKEAAAQISKRMGYTGL
ncbi:MAG: IclR family transcriptional regulator [Lachnospiraceae bacterium]